MEILSIKEKAPCAKRRELDAAKIFNFKTAVDAAAFYYEIFIPAVPDFRLQGTNIEATMFANVIYNHL